MKPNTLTNLKLLFLSVAVSLLLFELVARSLLTIGNGWPNNSYWMKEKWLEFHDDRRGNKNATMFVMHRYDSLLGWALKENLRQSKDYLTWVTNSNTKGLRGIHEYTYARNRKLRVLAIGDSFTFGSCVNDSQTIPAILEELLDSTEVINMGEAGYGHDQQLLRLITEGVKYKPDIILLGFVNDDIKRNTLSFRDYAKPYFTLQHDTLQLCGTPVPPPGYFLNPYRLRSFCMLKAKWCELTTVSNDTTGNALSQKILEKIQAVTQSINAQLIVVYLPWKEECLQNRAQPHWLYDSLCSQAGVISINPTHGIHQYLKQTKNPESQFACHYSPPLYRIVAEQIAEEVKKESNLNKHR